MFHQFLFILVMTFIIFILVKTGFPKTGHICYAKDAGFVQLPGLPGQIKTGCMASPAFKS